MIPATLYTCLLTAIGSTGAYALAYFCEPLVRAYVPKPIEALERRMDGKVRRPRELFSSLLVLRLVPIIPYSVVNAGAGVLRLPLWPFFGAWLGCNEACAHGTLASCALGLNSPG